MTSNEAGGGINSPQEEGQKRAGLGDFRDICTKEMIDNPAGEVVKLFRKCVRMTQPEAAGMAGLTKRGWQRAEEKGMKSQTFELLLLKTGQHPTFRLTRRYKD